MSFLSSCLSPLPQYSFAIKFICHMNFKLQFFFWLRFVLFLSLLSSLLSPLKNDKNSSPHHLTAFCCKCHIFSYHNLSQCRRRRRFFFIKNFINFISSCLLKLHHIPSYPSQWWKQQLRWEFRFFLLFSCCLLQTLMTWYDEKRDRPLMLMMLMLMRMSVSTFEIWCENVFWRKLIRFKKNREHDDGGKWQRFPKIQDRNWLLNRILSSHESHQHGTAKSTYTLTKKSLKLKRIIIIMRSLRLCDNWAFILIQTTLFFVPQHFFTTFLTFFLLHHFLLTQISSFIVHRHFSQVSFRASFLLLGCLWAVDGVDRRISCFVINFYVFFQLSLCLDHLASAR